jgi:hypothetical protein
MSMKRLSLDEAFLIAVNIASCLAYRGRLKDNSETAKFGQSGRLNPIP